MGFLSKLFGGGERPPAPEPAEEKDWLHEDSVKGMRARMERDAEEGRAQAEQGADMREGIKNEAMRQAAADQKSAEAERRKAKKAA